MTLADQVDASILPERMIAMLSALFGVTAAILVAIGLYGLLAYTVTRRINEIGIRIAIGATSRDVIWMVLRNGLGLVGVGRGDRSRRTGYAARGYYSPNRHRGCRDARCGACRVVCACPPRDDSRSRGCAPLRVGVDSPDQQKSRNNVCAMCKMCR